MSGEDLDRLSERPGVQDFEQLYRRWWGDLVALCSKTLGRRIDAEDAAQEAFVRAWLAHGQYSSTQPFWPWLATIARRLCVDRLRRLARESTDPTECAEFDESWSVIELTPERVVIAGADLELVFEAIDGLRGRDRRALLLREFGGWSYRRIAAVEGMTVEAVRGSLKRARASLRRSVLCDDLFEVGPRRFVENGIRRAEDAYSRTARGDAKPLTRL